MKWLRSKAKRLSLLALFALALQFGLSFGHVHHDAALAAPAAAALTDPSHASTPDTRHDHDGHDFCAICATIAMANTLVDAVPPALSFLPRTYAELHLAPGPQFLALNSRRHVFQSRAPPRS